MHKHKIVKHKYEHFQKSFASPKADGMAVKHASSEHSGNAASHSKGRGEIMLSRHG